MSDVIHIACCPEHGIHGERTECFECGGPVEQIAMVPLARDHEREELEEQVESLLNDEHGDISEIKARLQTVLDRWNEA